MNAVEIEEAVAELASAPFDRAEFPFAFLAAFGNKETAIRRLRAGATNQSDVDGGVLQRTNIHIAVCDTGRVGETLTALRSSPRTTSAKAKFILATDGATVEAEDLAAGEIVAFEYGMLPEHFGFFLPLAGISTVREIKNNPIDVKATGRLNKLYVELLKDNPEWAGGERRHELNQFMARLIFCFFAEDTGIFENNLFTRTLERMTDSQTDNTHEVLAELFRAMNTPTLHDGNPDDRYRKASDIKTWANPFPYVNGGLFSGTTECPSFSRIARTYLLRAGMLNWKEINPDIFGSMIQAVADDDERGELGMHYTSVPNILKVLNPLFLDDLRDQLEGAGENSRKLRNLRRRLSTIRVFDPACGSGNFLVIAYKEMRAIEHEIVLRTRDEPRSQIRLDNFYGIEIKGFAAEIARLALLIAEFQCDVRYLSQSEARSLVLPLHNTGRIEVGNALQLDWLTICPPAYKAVIEETDLAGPTGRFALDHDELNESSEPETYICGNPPYLGSRNQSESQKNDLKLVLSKNFKSYSSLDYVFGWIEKASDLVVSYATEFAFVSTNSVCQGAQVSTYWPKLFAKGLEINFAHRSFKWSNSASDNAGVTCVIVGIGLPRASKFILDGLSRYSVDHISPYLTSVRIDTVFPRSTPVSDLEKMNSGNYPGDGNHLTLTRAERDEILAGDPDLSSIIAPLYGAQEFIKGLNRYCLWIEDKDLERAMKSPIVAERIRRVYSTRIESRDASYNRLAEKPHQFRDRNRAKNLTILAPTVSSERREYLPIDVFDGRIITTNQCFALYDAPLWNVAILASKLHLVWVVTVCGKLKTDIRYSNTMGWNTFPLPPLTTQNRIDLENTAKSILLARQSYFPASIADLYKSPDRDGNGGMPEELRRAHDANDEVLERIYIGRRFKNDTERLEILFDLYTKMTANPPQAKPRKSKAPA